MSFVHTAVLTVAFSHADIRVVSCSDETRRTETTGAFLIEVCSWITNSMVRKIKQKHKNKCQEAERNK